MSRSASADADALADTELFGTLSAHGAETLRRTAKRVTVRQGEILSVPGDVGYIISGTAEVLRDPCAGGRKVVINVLSDGDFFGMAGAFGAPSGPGTAILARSECEAVFVPGDTIREFVRTEPDFAEAYVSLLSGKLRFLSRRVRDFSSESAVSRLSCYLASAGSSECSVSELSRRLGIGRTSMYRALETLEEAGAVKRNGKLIETADRSALESFCVS